MSTQQQTNVDPGEIHKFSENAHRWWDPTGEYRPLHEMNPLRLDYIDSIAPLKNKRILDVGCGGGILSESMAQRGADVTGIDMAEAALKVARLHQIETGVAVQYEMSTAETYALTHPASFDVVTCLEMLEHVPDPASIVNACAELVRPGGWVFFSTINRNLKSFLFAIVGAEYIMGILPKGTHEYAKFIRPSELARWCRDAGLTIQQSTGMGYHPYTRQFYLQTDVGVNYLTAMRRE